MREKSLKQQQGYNPFLNLVAKQREINDLKHHSGFKAITEYMNEMLYYTQITLNTNWLGKDNIDRSDLLRGRIQILTEFLNLTDAIEEFKNQTEKTQKEGAK